MSTRISGIKRGDSVILNLVIKEDGVVANITGWTIYFTAKENLTDTPTQAVIPTKTITEHDDPQNGITAIELTHDDTDIPAGTYFYDIRAKKLDGTIFTVASSQLEISLTPTDQIS